MSTLSPANPPPQLRAAAAAAGPETTSPVTTGHPIVRGKYLYSGDQKLHIRGVTYGPFRPEADGCEYHTPERARADFRQMAAAGVNTVRVYTVPPRWLLDAAADHGLRVMVGLPWEQHVTFLDDRARAADIVRRVREGIRQCAGHPALLAYAVGNEIPASIVRWHGHRKVERFIRRLYDAVKAEDATALVTYVNYPSTEYLYLPFLDFVCFNVYLESRERLEAYLARLQNIAGDRPLVMAEIGLDSLRNGDERQGQALEWQIRSVFDSGCAGVFVFAWTDEWFRGGHNIDDWKFGLTTIERDPKPALEVVKRAYADTPFAPDRAWPRVTVAVCTRNGARTIRDALEGVRKLAYPNYEVVVVDDGSTDDTARVCRGYDVRLISTPPQGLSAARNAALAAAQGEIIAYLDDDAWPDAHWLMYLADAFAKTDHAGVGGPNVAPPGNGSTAEAVSRAPGGPTHVLVDDRLAEHLPGCNMAFRVDRLREIGGFDSQFTVAGDDVDVCWRIQERGWTLGFTAGAMVWHHRRDSVWRFWKQQYHYGAAEGMLERKWPQRYTSSGQIAWSGRLYDHGISALFGRSSRRIYHGTWGSALFQSVYHVSAGFWATLGLMPEWYLMIVVLAAVGLAGIAWPPLLWTTPLLGLAALVSVGQAVAAARKATFVESRDGWHRARAVAAWLHLTQPVARLLGRFRHGATPWRIRGTKGFEWPWPKTVSAWHETWASPEARLEAVERQLRAAGGYVVRGGDYDAWDLQLRGGTLGAVRVRLAIEEHGSGKQMAKYAARPWWSRRAWVLLGLCAVVGGLAAMGRAWGLAGVCGVGAGVVVLRALYECGAGMAAVREAVCGKAGRP